MIVPSREPFLPGSRPMVAIDIEPNIAGSHDESFSFKTKDKGLRNMAVW